MFTLDDLYLKTKPINVEMGATGSVSPVAILFRKSLALGKVDA